jgi:DNA-binding transcriptional MerR regulator
MPEVFAHVEIPKRALFKAAEVCDLVKLQPYVLRSWEAEFPQLGIAREPGGPRTYRRTDVERVVRIKHLLLVEGLTLAGARRRLEEEETPVAAQAPLDELVGQNARERLTAVKRGLRSILDLLSQSNGSEDAAPGLEHRGARASRASLLSAVRPMPVVRDKRSASKTGRRRNGAGRKRSA